MYVHVGGEYSIPDRLIIGIFDMDSITPKQTDMIRFLAEAEKAGHVEYVSEEIPRSVVVSVDRIYFSPISTATLRKRIIDMHTHPDKAYL
ncbi:MAG: DUF370 domain-containing protein [Eubacteriales bacterium]